MTANPWTIEPLKGKYYGTKIVNNETDEVIEVWLGFIGNYTASEREKEQGWGQPDEDGFVDIYYDHVELQRSYDAAIIICEALNERLK